MRSLSNNWRGAASTFEIIIVIPVYNHSTTLCNMITRGLEFPGDTWLSGPGSVT